MKTTKGHKSTPLSLNRKMVIASASVTKEKNAIHSFTEIDITEPRRRLKEHFERTGEKLSFTAYIVACMARVVKDHPRVNSFIKGRKLILLDDITISVLVERDIKGEQVPEPIAIKGAGSKTYREISNEIREAKKLQSDKLGTLSGFTWIRFIPNFLLKSFIRIADRNISMAKRYGKLGVTAVGMFSKEGVWFIPHGTATVLLTVGSITNKVIEVEGEFVSREHLCLTASFDHNIVDGAPAARFLSQLIDTIKSGELLELGID
ncbi:MAG: 2-oxo acid dehydrogenase subunit E2 [Bacteroidetes bacterium]|nr:2-oxo acid dehydrogenase subunit E2 [Bacteroidota bacterium]